MSKNSHIDGPAYREVLEHLAELDGAREEIALAANRLVLATTWLQQWRQEAARIAGRTTRRAVRGRSRKGARP